VILRQMAHLLPISSDRLGSTALAQGAPVPYAIAIAAGALLVLPQAQMFAVYTG
jgi:prepilin peptidase CpaA